MAVTDTTTPAQASPVNAHAWPVAAISAAVLWVAIAVVLVVGLDSPYTALSFVAPLALGAGVTALAASRARPRIPVGVYPPVILAIALAANAPLLALVF